MFDLEASPDGYVKEKATSHTIVIDETIGETHVVDINDGYLPGFRTLSKFLERFGVESRGFQRVLPEERSPQSFWGLCLIW